MIEVNTLADWDDEDEMFEEKLIEITYPTNGVGMDFFASIAAVPLPSAEDDENVYCPYLSLEL